MSKFKEEFKEPVAFSNNTLVIDGALTAEEAAKEFSAYAGEDITAEDVKKDRVRYGFAPDFVEGMDGAACWYTGGEVGKGSMLVWVFG